MAICALTGRLSALLHFVLSFFDHRRSLSLTENTRVAAAVGRDYIDQICKIPIKARVSLNWGVPLWRTNDGFTPLLAGIGNRAADVANVF